MTKRMLSVLLVVCALLGLFSAAGYAQENEIERCDLYAQSNLLRMGYSDLDNVTELAVGDTLDILYESSIPADVYLNGTAVQHFDAGEFYHYAYRLSDTGSVTIAVLRENEEILSRSFTVIPSAEMYKKEVRRYFKDIFSVRLSDFTTPREAIEGGFPLFNPFLPLAFAVMVTVNFCTVIFSFFRIVR